MTVEQYRAAQGLNFSRMKHLLKSPLHFKNEKAVEETLAMRMGTAVDEWILTGKTRPTAIKPSEIDGAPWQGNRKVCKQWVKDQEAAGNIVYSQEEFEKLGGMQRALESSADFRNLLQMCPERQKPVFFTYRGVEMKCLLDMAGWHRSGQRCISDLKTTRDGSKRAFGKQAFNGDLDLQAVLYSTAIAITEGLDQPPAFMWATVESSAAAPVTIYALPDAAMASGQKKLDACVDLYLECMEKDVWPGYGAGIQDLIWPRWADRGEEG